MKILHKYLKPYIPRMFLGFLIKISGVFMELGLPWILAYMIDEVIPIGKISLILMWGFIMLLLSIGARNSNVKANRRASRVAADTVKQIRHDLFWKIEHLSGAQVDYFTIPSLESRMTSDTYNIHHMVGMMQRLGVRAPIILLGGIIITFTLEPVLTLVLVAILPLLAFSIYYISKKGIVLYTKAQNYVDRMIQILRENISGIRVIKALSKTEYEKQRFENINQEVVNKELKASSTMAFINPIVRLLLNIGLTLIVVVGAFRVNSGASQPGKIVAFLSYFTMMLNAMIGVTRIFTILSKANASLGRIGEVLEAEEDLKQEEEKNYPSLDSEYEIEFDHVTFSYHKKDEDMDLDTTPLEEENKECVSDICFRIKKGETLGIIGSTGSGKTTLISLLMRYYDVDSGCIRINGNDIRTMPMKELRKRFGVVFQNDFLYAGTVSENIDFGRNLSRSQIEQASTDAQAIEFIEQLGVRNELSMENDSSEPSEALGYQFDYHVASKGANLSGGQKQRLLLSRALAGNPNILILDDSSSALDYKTDSKLRSAIRTHFSHTTLITVAQRISSIMYMDHIMVLEDGKIVGYGDHEDLMNTCDIYQEIYKSQMGSA